MHRTPLIGAAALLLSWPAVAQQPAPSSPPPPVVAPQAPPGQGPGIGMMGGRGPGAMMGGPGMGGPGAGRMGPGTGRPASGLADDDDDDDDDRPGPGWRHRHRGQDTPMQIIINIGPNNRVEVEDGESRGDRRGDRRWMGRPGAMREGARPDPTRMVEAHLGAVRDALQLRPDQQPAWDRFAGAVRDASGRMMRARVTAMTQAQGLEERIASYEAALASRLEAVRGLRGAFSALSSSLDETQRRTLDESAAAFMGMGRMGWR